MADSMQRRTRKVALGLLMMGGLWVAVYWWWPVSPPVSFAVVRQQAVTPLRGEEKSSMQARPVVSYAPQQNGGTTGGSPTPNPSQPPQEGLTRGVIPPKFATHVVEQGETLESISLMYYGTSKHVDAIARANPMLSPPDLKAGKQVLVPLDPSNVQGVVATRTAEEAKAAAGAKPSQPQLQILQEYQVQEGDSLAKIARDVYGSEKDADLIFRANKDKLSDPSKIRIGQKLKIPVKPKG
ncbi:MAG: LysM peptidoglycan-binding domain-containing protein [Phycisphaerales bacterium]